MLRTFPGATGPLGNLAATVNYAGVTWQTAGCRGVCVRVSVTGSEAENRSLRLGNRGKERCVSFHTGSVSFRLPSLYRTRAGSGSVCTTRFFPIILLLFRSLIMSNSLGHREL